LAAARVIEVVARKRISRAHERQHLPLWRLFKHCRCDQRSFREEGMMPFTYERANPGRITGGPADTSVGDLPPHSQRLRFNSTRPTQRPIRRTP
jgi:hypothetical protein